MDSNDLVNAIKKAATDAVDASKPANLVFGTVASASPLQINVDQKMTLGAAQLVLSRNVTNYTVSVTVGWETANALSTHNHTINMDTGSGGEDSHTHTVNGSTVVANLTHKHGVTGTKQMTINNALQVGEKVIMMQVAGGQQYVVLDRIG